MGACFNQILIGQYKLFNGSNVCTNIPSELYRQNHIFQNCCKVLAVQPTFTSISFCNKSQKAVGLRTLNHLVNYSLQNIQSRQTVLQTKRIAPSATSEMSHSLMANAFTSVYLNTSLFDVKTAEPENRYTVNLFDFFFSNKAKLSGLQNRSKNE